MSSKGTEGGDAGVAHPIPGWWNILKRVYADLSVKNVSVLAAGVAFFAMLSIFPALATLIAVYGLLANPESVQHLISAMGGFVPLEAQKLIIDYLQSVVTSSHSRLGISLFFSVIFGLWSARYGVSTTIASLNVIYGEQEQRGTVQLYAISLAITVAAIIFVAIVLTLVAAVPAAADLLPIGGKSKMFGALVRWPILIFFLVLGLASIYRFAPCRAEARWRWVTWGSVVAVILWLAVSAAFSFYVARFGRYDKTFGSLGAGVVLLTWLYLSAYAIFLGACLDAEMERPTAN